MDRIMVHFIPNAARERGSRSTSKQTLPPENYEQAPMQYIQKYYQEDVIEESSPESKFYQRYLVDVNGTAILNVGCGPQFYNDLSFFGSKPKEYFGIDINKNTIKFLRESKNPFLLKAKEQARYVESKVLERDILLYEPKFKAKFDFVIAIAVLGMFKKSDFQRAIENIRTYLKPGGMLLDADWTDANLSREAYCEKVRYRFYTDEGPSIIEQSQILRRSGFKILKYDSYNPNKKTYKWGKIFIYLTEKL